MRRLLALVTLLIPAVGSAQPGLVEPLAPDVPNVVTDPYVLSLARETHLAAARGDCDVARALGSQIARLDPGFHRAVIKTDSEIVYCRPARPSSSEPPREGAPSIDGATLVGEALVGGLFCVGGAIVGGLIGNGLAEHHDEGLMLGGFVGGTLMAAVGVNLIGDDDEKDGSIGYAIGGAVLGGLAGFGTAVKGDFEDGTIIALLISGPTLGAMLGHSMTLTYKPKRAHRTGPGYDRRLALQPSARITDGVGITFATGSF